MDRPTGSFVADEEQLLVVGGQLVAAAKRVPAFKAGTTLEERVAEGGPKYMEWYCGFALLVTQGSSQRRQMSRSMVWDSRDPEQRLHTLAVLGILDNRVLLRDAVRPVLHCLGAHDALVPVAAAGPLAQVQQLRIDNAALVAALAILPLCAPWAAVRAASTSGAWRAAA